MGKYIFDIETNGLYYEATRMWIIGFKCLDTGDYFEFTEGDFGWRPLIENAEMLVGHSIIDFDLPVLQKLYNSKPPESCKIIDTLILSRVLDYKRFGREGHSLEAWGQSLGYPKLPKPDFSRYSPEMSVYLERDVLLNEKVYKDLLKELKELSSMSPFVKRYLEFEHSLAEWVSLGNKDGWPFDEDSARKLLCELERFVEEVTDKLEGRLGYKCVPKDKVHGIVTPKSPVWVANGCYSARTADWFHVDVLSGLDDPELNELPFHRMILGDYSRVTFEPLRLSSTQDVKLFLFRNGWEPDEWNYTKDPHTGERIKSSPKITESSLEYLGGDGQLYKEYNSASSRLSIIKTFLDNLDEEGYLHGDCNVIGTPSMRATHSVIVNIPSVDSFKGREMRRLFITEKGWSLVGADSSGNQARGLAHFLKNEEYVNILLNDDIHTYNAKKMTSALAEMGIDHEVPRNASKRIFYASLFGAGGDKLWSYLFGYAHSAKGNKFKKIYQKSIPGFAELIEKLSKVFGKTRQMGDGYIPSLVGTPIYVDSFHKLLVYLLQSTEKITCSAAVHLTMKWLREEGIPFKPKTFMHDEIQFTTPHKYAERAAELAALAFKEGPKLVGVVIMDGNSKIGNNWEDTH